MPQARNSCADTRTEPAQISSSRATSGGGLESSIERTRAPCHMERQEMTAVDDRQGSVALCSPVRRIVSRGRISGGS
jgi:hypothetical protein